MANVLYPKFKEALLNKEHDLNTDQIKAYLIDNADYTYSATHITANTSNVAAAAIVATSAAFTNPTITDGVFDANDFTWSTVTGDPAENIILWNDSTTSPTVDALIAFYDSVTGLPVTPNGGNINVTVHSSGWFAL